MGTYVGLVIEERLSIGRVIVRIISNGSSKNSLVEFLTASNYGVTCLDAKGTRGDVTIILTLVNRSDLPSLIYHIEQQYPDSFYSIEDIRSANGGVFRPKSRSVLTGCLSSIVKARKKK